MATLVTADGETYEFGEIRIAETGTYLCFADARGADTTATPRRIFPAEAVQEVIPKETVERDPQLLHREGHHSQDEPIDPRGPPHAARVIVDYLVR